MDAHQDLLPFGPVYGFMAGMTDREKVLFGVVSRMASELLLMHFEASHCAAELGIASRPAPEWHDEARCIPCFMRIGERRLHRC